LVRVTAGEKNVVIEVLVMLWVVNILIAMVE
jgi:hypothetical protein